MKYEAVIFDLDGTLLDTLGDISDSVNFALGRSGLPTYTEAEYRKMVGHGLKALVRDALGPMHSSFQEQVYTDLMAYYRDNCVNRTSVYKGIPELLDGLSRIGVVMSILSNKENELVQKITGKLLSDWEFKYIQGTKADIPKKPDPRSVFIALDRMKSSDDRTLFVGDSEVDILTAANAVLSSAAVSWGFRDIEQLRQAAPDIIVSDTMELSAFF